MSDSDKSALGDCCQNHYPLTAPVVYPYRATLTGDSLRAEYRCGCGSNWSCWWSASAAGWDAADVERLNQAPVLVPANKPGKNT
jgi:hypothetical protein